MSLFFVSTLTPLPDVHVVDYWEHLQINAIDVNIFPIRRALSYAIAN